METYPTPELTYDLDEFGWAEMTIRIGSACSELVVSYLTDPLRDICVSMMRLLRGSVYEFVCTTSEPTEFRLIFRRNLQLLQVQVLGFEDLYEPQPDECGWVEFQAECELSAFVQAVISLLDSILHRYGMKQYKKLWILEEFPLTELQELKQVFGQEQS